MRISDFDLYRDLLKRESGLSLSPDKSYLLDSRLTPVAKKWKYPTLESMTLTLRGMPEPELVKDIVEAMAIGETSFYRNIKPFEALQGIVIPYLVKNRKKKRDIIRIWSAGCSSGQEPYSIAMVLHESGAIDAGMRFEILATDISEAALAYGETGQYSQFEVQRGLPIRMLIKYFDQGSDNWRVKENVRELVEFENFNLLHDMYPLGEFDIIFCRNILMYFDKDTITKTLQGLAENLVDDGFLFLGNTETALECSNAFKPVSVHKNIFVPTSSNFEESLPENKAIASS